MKDSGTGSRPAIIIFLMITGFEIHGTYTLMGYETAVKTHNFVGISWLVLFAFFVFWLFTTGEVAPIHSHNQKNS